MSLQIMGYSSNFFTTVSFMPQAIKTLKTRKVEDLSLITYLFLFRVPILVSIWQLFKRHSINGYKLNDNDSDWVNSFSYCEREKINYLKIEFKLLLCKLILFPC